MRAVPDAGGAIRERTAPAAFDRILNAAHRGARASWTPLALPFAALVAYSVVLALKWGGFFRSVALNSDTTSVMLLSNALLSRAHGFIHLVNARFYNAFLLDLATRGLPAYRVIWEAWPYGAYVVGVLVLTWSVRRAAGNKPAAVSLLVAIALIHRCFSPFPDRISTDSTRRMPCS